MGKSPPLIASRWTHRGGRWGGSSLGPNAPELERSVGRNVPLEEEREEDSGGTRPDAWLAERARRPESLSSVTFGSCRASTERISRRNGGLWPPVVRSTGRSSSPNSAGTGRSESGSEYSSTHRSIRWANSFRTDGGSRSHAPGTGENTSTTVLAAAKGSPRSTRARIWPIPSRKRRPSSAVDGWSARRPNSGASWIETLRTSSGR